MNRREVISLFGTAGIFGLAVFENPDNDNGNNKNTLINNDTKIKNNQSDMKTIGILGGLGPQATMDMEMRLHKAAQQLIPPMQNGGYPPVIVQYYRHPPVLLTAAHKPAFPWQPDPRLLDAAKNIGAMADFLIIPSNGAHLFQKEIEQAANRKVISMIDETLQEVKTRGWKKVGVLGLMNPKVYTGRLQEMGIAFEVIDDTLQEKLNQAIMKVMEGREDEADKAVALQAIRALRNKKVDGIIPGCTEIPLLLGKNMEAPDLLNPAQLLAEAAIKFSMN